MKYISFILVLFGFLLSSCKIPEFDSENPPWGTECSQSIGSNPCDFTFKDQNNNDVSLYDYYGKIIILDISAMWCGPCQSAAKEVEEIHQKYGKDVVYLTVLIDDMQFEAPRVVDAKTWADAFGIVGAPVLAGNRDITSHSYDLGWVMSSFPTFFIINRDMEFVLEEVGFRRGRIEEIILDMLAQESDSGAP